MKLTQAVARGAQAILARRGGAPQAPLKQACTALLLGFLGAGCAPAAQRPASHPSAPSGGAAPSEPSSALARSHQGAASGAASAAGTEGAPGDEQLRTEPGGGDHPPLPPPPAVSCPEEMTAVTRFKGAYCIDRYEASLVYRKDEARVWPHNDMISGRERELRAVSVAGRRPQGHVSGKQAAALCAASGKRLCAIDEWATACRGPARTQYPYGNKRQRGVCNDRYKVLDHHPVPRLFKQTAAPGDDPVLMWHPKFMNDRRLLLMDHTTAPTGSFEGCVNDYGVYDMVGNLHEWVADADGTFMGGFFMDTFQNGEGCGYRTIGHGFDYHDYSTGFRCCQDAAWSEASQSAS